MARVSKRDVERGSDHKVGEEDDPSGVGLESKNRRWAGLAVAGMHTSNSGGHDAEEWGSLVSA